MKPYLKLHVMMKSLIERLASLLTSTSCPSEGDQLTQVRFTSGHKLRAGGHTSKDRLEHTQPDVIELFHIKQAFLTVSVSQNILYDYVLRLLD